MGTVAVVGTAGEISRAVSAAGTELECVAVAPEALSAWKDSDACPDAVVLGQALADPVPTLTTLGRCDAELPVFVLRDPTARQALVNRLRFAPGIGRHIRIWDSDSIDSLLLELAAAAHRRTSREALSRGLDAAQQHQAKPSDFMVLDEILDFAPVGIAIVDHDARILALNREGERLLGWSRNSALGQSVLSRFDVSQRDALSTLVADCFAGQASTVPLAFQLRRPTGGARRDLHLSIGRIGRSSTVTACAAYLDDVTELVSSKRKLEQARDQLEDRINARTRALSEVKKRLEQRTRALEQSNSELARAKAELEQLSLKDALTGLFNRHYLSRQLEEECRRARRAETALALMMLDIDHFKPYNDMLGHPEGDQCLIRIADLIHTACRRAGEFVVRYGGEEFLVVMPDGTPERAKKLAAAIRDAIELAALPHPLGGHVTVSVGVCSAQGDALSDPKSILKRADQALYVAKRTGRNRWQLAET